MEPKKIANQNVQISSKVYEKVDTKTVIALFIGLLGFLMLLFIPDTTWSIRATLAITFLGLVLWIFELFSFGLTSLLILILYVLFQTVSIDEALSGFSTGATFLIVGGMMMAQGVHSTTIGQRVVYSMLKVTGNSPGALLFGIIMIPQILSLFIPATGVRTTLVLPVILALINILQLQDQVNYKKQMMLSVAYGGNISGIGFLPAAIGNVLVVEIVYIYTGTTISYFDWFLYTFPIWLLSIPVTWYVVYKAYPIQFTHLRDIRKELEIKIRELGKLGPKDKRCLVILLLTVLLWVSQGLHGLHPAIPALIAAVLMGIPGIGIARWDQLSKIDVNMLLLVGVTLSIGRILNDTGSIDYVTSILFSDVFLAFLQHPLLAVFTIVIIVQLFHLGVSNVGTAVITIVPVFMTVALQISADPIAFAVIAGITSVLGFILVVETIPNVLAHSTRLISQKDFYIPGIILTLLTTLIVVLVVMTWWQWMGLY
ncbi:anion transporter [Caldalkalibacillus uzonensis]|uniref:Sodium-dependent dicarboxylate transporter SdcS n=1 Tax=Caldalkalibacillus uzonensis TaxID=353224 RepID=A0ABU0CWH7_9BACI|nr:DASS family sodium-coupled anion symporter [Caldalkalibacillus uzonensis]MDQ0340779.1 anion transporter [Caldalkalibacillus uzonensis]